MTQGAGGLLDGGTGPAVAQLSFVISPVLCLSFEHITASAVASRCNFIIMTKPDKVEQPAGEKVAVLPDTDSHAAANGGLEASTRLEEMGYKQELRRSLGMVSVLGLSFAIMAVPFGTSTTLNIALTNGGPVTVIWGVSVCAFETLEFG